MKKTLAVCCLIAGASLVGYGVLSNKRREDAALVRAQAEEALRRREAETTRKLNEQAFELSQLLIRLRSMRLEPTVDAHSAQSLADSLRDLGSEFNNLLGRIALDEPSKELRTVTMKFTVSCESDARLMSEGLARGDRLSLQVNYSVVIKSLQEMQSQAGDYLTLLAAKAR